MRVREKGKEQKRREAETESRGKKKEIRRKNTKRERDSEISREHIVEKNYSINSY